MAEAEFIPPEQLRREWETVRPMLERVRIGGAYRWISEDIYHACFTGRAQLYLARENSQPTGVLVLERVLDWGVPIMHAWICYHASPDKTIADYWPWLVSVAQAAGCKRIRTDAHRRGHDRVIPVKAIRTIYECEVP